MKTTLLTRSLPDNCNNIPPVATPQAMAGHDISSGSTATDGQIPPSIRRTREYRPWVCVAVLLHIGSFASLAQTTSTTTPTQAEIDAAVIKAVNDKATAYNAEVTLIKNMVGAVAGAPVTAPSGVLSFDSNTICEIALLATEELEKLSEQTAEAVISQLGERRSLDFVKQNTELLAKNKLNEAIWMTDRAGKKLNDKVKLQIEAELNVAEAEKGMEESKDDAIDAEIKKNEATKKLEEAKSAIEKTTASEAAHKATAIANAAEKRETTARSKLNEARGKAATSKADVEKAKLPADEAKKNESKARSEWTKAKKDAFKSRVFLVSGMPTDNSPLTAVIAYRKIADKITLDLTSANKVASDLLSTSTDHKLEHQASFGGIIGAGADFQGALSLASLLRVSVDIKGAHLDTNDEGFICLLAQDLKKAGVDVTLGGFNPKSPILAKFGEADKQAETAIEYVGKIDIKTKGANESLDKAKKKLDAATTDADKATGEKEVSRDKQEVDDCTAASKALETALGKYTGAYDALQKNGLIAGVSPATVMAMDDIVPEDNVPEDNFASDTFILYVKNTYLGGTDISKTKLLGSKGSITAAATARYLLLKSDGTFVSSALPKTYSKQKDFEAYSKQ